jgi:hypothetical protein
MEFRCPFHDVVFDTDTDSRKPGTRMTDSEGKQTGEHVHPLYKVGTGYIAGHPDCSLCQRAIAADDPQLLKPTKPAAEGRRPITGRVAA